MSKTRPDVALIKDEIGAQGRQWESFYRNRWQYDKIVRSTHGVNCTGSCTWYIHVKDGIVTWEMQGLDYPKLNGDIPPYEPRGCQRGISFSWYLYSPLRVKYPYVRGALLDLWREAKTQFPDPVDAWHSLVSDPVKRKRWQVARGKGGFRRAHWDEALEIIAASQIDTIKTYGPDRIAGFSPIPAMSMVSYAAGARMLQLMGGVSLSFYDWYSDLPNASPETWGEQTDVQESADWYNAKMLAVVGSNLSMTRTPDVHFAVEARHNGSKMVVFSPDFSQVAKYADEWIAINAGQDGAWWMAVNHVILKEYLHDKEVPYFRDYLKKYSDAPLLVELTQNGHSYKAGQLLRADRLKPYAGEENGEWKFLAWDDDTNKPKMPMGSVGHRWGKDQGKWNLELKDGADGSPIAPRLSFIDDHDKVLQVELDNFAAGTTLKRGVPVKMLKTEGGIVPVATVLDLLMAQYGVGRGLDGEYPADYDDADAPYTPAWAEQYTGIGRKDLIKFARDWASTAELTEGKCTVIIGAGINHWYHANLMYRAAIHALMFTGCIGKNGGGLAHYVGQEKLAPGESWSAIALGKDWYGPSRLQNGPSWHYVHSDQWRYERDFTDYHTVPKNAPDDSLAKGHTMDMQVRAVKSGWLPFFPQFDVSSLDLAQEARKSGATNESEVADYVVEKLKSGDLKFAIEDPDAEENFPRIWFIWRGNAIMSSAKGHEYFLEHYLGTHNNHVGDPGFAKGSVEEVTWHDKVPKGKMDLIIDLNFRMDTSALYSDIVLPAATWYEKADLNTTDMHSFIHPLAQAVPPCWESKSDWVIFREIAKVFSEMSKKHFPDTYDDIIASPLLHDTPGEIAQPSIKAWWKGEIEAIPGKTMPSLKVVTRDFKNLYNQFISLGPLVRKNGLGAHGTSYKVDDFYDEMLEQGHTTEWDDHSYPSIKEDTEVCDAILRLATTTNGELAWRSYKNMEEKVGLPLADLAEKNRGVRTTYEDLLSQPRRLLNSPMWSGLTENGRPYSSFTYNIERNVPWRTLTGRQQFYLDHPGYIMFGEHLPTYKPKPMPKQFAETGVSELADSNALMLNYLTPHGKWHIHSTYGDNERMFTLSRGVDPFWMNDKDAESIGIVDNDWVEVYNDNGVVVTRANVTARIPRGIAIIYHSPERTYSVPKSPMRGNRRAGGHNSLTRTRLKPNLMVGGYGQFTYHFNYWGPTGNNRDTFIMVRKLPALQW